MSTLQERLALAMKGPPAVTAADLVRACGVKGASVSEWINGPTQSLRGPNAIRAAKRLSVNVEWLSTGNGPMRSADGPKQAVASPETQPGYVRFPLLEGYAGMGRGDYIGDYPEIMEFVEVTREWAEQTLRGVPFGAVRVITGRGPSMRGMFNDGDPIFLDSRVKQFLGDAVYCFRWNGLVYIKKLQMIGKGQARILSANPDYDPVEAPMQELEIGGRALRAWTLTEF